MNRLTLVSEFCAKGIHLRSDGANLTVSPREKITHVLARRIRQNKAALIKSLELLREKAGDDWAEIAADPDQLRAFADAVAVRQTRESGQVPPHYTSTTTCRRCGPVPVWPGLPDQVAGCPWCHNRLSGQPVPNVATVLSEPNRQKSGVQYLAST